MEKKAVSYVNIGSGLIFDRQGHIITRSSIVLGADHNTITLANGVQYPAEFVGHDPETGFAVLKIEGENLVPAKLGDSDRLSVGNWIIIIGNSLGVYPSVVVGSLSGLREDGIIQVSALLDPGNNGSPIFNTDGEIVGIVAARLNTGESSAEPFWGYNFSQTTLAYPINWIKRIAQDILEFGYVRKGWLGVVGKNDASKPEIKKVLANSPAQKVGLSVGDIIVKYSDKRVSDIEELARLVQYTQPGKVVSLQFLRNDQLKDVDIKIGEKTYANKPEFALDRTVPVPTSLLNRSLRTDSPNNSINWMERNQILEMRVNHLEKELAQLKKLLQEK
ncbi:MAG: S1C family serine protease [bacterium]